MDKTKSMPNKSHHYLALVKICVALLIFGLFMAHSIKIKSVDTNSDALVAGAAEPSVVANPAAQTPTDKNMIDMSAAANISTRQDHDADAALAAEMIDSDADQDRSQQHQLQGHLILPDDFQAEHDIKLRMWTESGSSGTGYATFSTIYAGEKQASFSVTVNGPASAGYQLSYICEYGCSGIVGAYFQKGGAVIERYQAYIFNDGLNYENIAFPILIGDKITGQVELADGPARQDIKLSLFVDDVQGNIGKTNRLPIILPAGQQSVSFGLGLASGLNNSWRIGLHCNKGCVDDCTSMACAAYYANGYFHSDGLVES